MSLMFVYNAKKERWESLGGCYHVWIQARIRHGKMYELEWAAMYVPSETWLCERDTKKGAMRLCREHQREIAT